jgi:hypothetical protein
MSHARWIAGSDDEQCSTVGACRARTSYQIGPNFELADSGVGSIAECRYKPRQRPLNRPECRFNSLSGHQLATRAMAALRLPIIGLSSGLANHMRDCSAAL